MRSTPAVERGEGLDRDAARLRIDREERQAVRLVGSRRRCARRRKRHPPCRRRARASCVHRCDKRRSPCEPSRRHAPGHSANRLRRTRAPGAASPLASAGSQRLHCAGVPGLGQQLACQHDARQPRAAAEAAPEFLRDQHQLDGALPAAAELRHRRAGRAARARPCRPSADAASSGVSRLPRWCAGYSPSQKRCTASRNATWSSFEEKSISSASVQAARKALAIRLRCTSLAPP